MKKIIYVAVFSAAFIMSSCCACRKTVKVDMLDSHWLLTEVNGHVIDRATAPNAQNKFSLTLGKENRFSGQGDCNRYFGQYTIDANNKTISFDKAASTMMMCLDQQSEDKYLKSLEKVTQYKVDGKFLILMDEEEVVIATFKQDPRPQPAQ